MSKIKILFLIFISYLIGLVFPTIILFIDTFFIPHIQNSPQLFSSFFLIIPILIILFIYQILIVYPLFKYFNKKNKKILFYFMCIILSLMHIFIFTILFSDIKKLGLIDLFQTFIVFLILNMSYLLPNIFSLSILETKLRVLKT